MKTQNLIEIIENKTLDQIEAEILQLATSLQEMENDNDYIIVDIFCNDCFYKTNRDIKKETETENEICENCGSENLDLLFVRPFVC